MPDVSIVTPLYQAEATIADTLASVAAQTFSDYEHLVIDNGSTDGGPGIVRAAAHEDPRIHLLSQTATQGPGPTRNAGIAAARGRFIAFLDADDLWTPDKLDRQIGAMTDSGAAFSWTAYRVLKDGTPSRIQDVRTHMTAADLLWKRGVIGCLTAVYDTQTLGTHFMNALPMRQDFCLWYDLLQACAERDLPVLGLREPLALYRVHGSSLTADKRKAARLQWQAYRGHVGLGRLHTAALFGAYAARALAVRAGIGKTATETGAPDVKEATSTHPRETPT